MLPLIPPSSDTPLLPGTAFFSFTLRSFFLSPVQLDANSLVESEGGFRLLSVLGFFGCFWEFLLRNRLLNRRKSGEKLDRMNSSHGNDGDKSSSTLRNAHAANYGDSGTSNYQSENSNSGLIVVDGCSSSEALQLMINRWTSAMASYNDSSIGISEKPIIYSSSSGPAWGSVKLPHQMDFLTELRHAIQAANEHANAGGLPKPKVSVSGRS